MLSNLRRELLALRARDDKVRARLAADGLLFQGYHSKMEAVHRENAARLRAIIGGHGWPDRTMVGEDGAAAAGTPPQSRIPRTASGCMRGALSCTAPSTTGMQRDGGWSPWVGWRSRNTWTSAAPPSAFRRSNGNGRHLRMSRPPADLAGRQREMDEWAVRTRWRRG